MAIPDFQTLMRPLLAFAADGQDWAIRDLRDNLADAFAVSATERAELLPSGRAVKLDNRVHWAVFHLVKAGLLERTGRGRVRITPRGHESLSAGSERIDLAFLARYPEFQEFRQRARKDGTHPQPTVVVLPANDTPEEAVEAANSLLRSALIAQIGEKLAACSPTFNVL